MMAGRDVVINAVIEMITFCGGHNFGVQRHSCILPPYMSIKQSDM